MTTNGDIGDLVARRLAEIEAETERIERALGHLRGTPLNSARGAVRTPSSPLRRTATGTRGRSARRGRRAEEVLAFVEAHPGSTATLIAESVGISAGNVHQVVRKLRTEGRLADGVPLRPPS